MKLKITLLILFFMNVLVQAQVYENRIYDAKNTDHFCFNKSGTEDRYPIVTLK
jgi:hypothetical protein